MLAAPVTIVAALAVATAAAQEPPPAPPDHGPLTNMLLSQPLAETRTELERRISDRTANDNDRLALGVTRLLQAVERLGQSLYRYGFEPTRDLDMLTFVGVPSPRFPLPSSAQPEEISYDDLRRIIQCFLDDLAEVDAALAGIRDPSVKFALPIGLIRLDFDRDGRRTDEERLWKLFARLTNIRNLSYEDALAFVIKLDRADVEWLRGYTHLLRALCHCALAYDFRELFERTGHLLFVKPASPYSFLARRVRKSDHDGFIDLIAVIHLLNFKLREPARMVDAHGHLRRMIAHSRNMWRLVREETDDDGEWIPSARQRGVIPGVQFSDAMIDGWLSVLTESEELLSGRKLIPFWRNDARGVNLQKVFLEPRDIDLVMWLQGTDAAPFLTEGEKTSPDVWQRFNDLFQGRLFAYAAWVN
jgi:hypothetical protein